MGFPAAGGPPGARPGGPPQAPPPAAGNTALPATGYDDTPIQVPGYWNMLPAECGGDWGAYDHYRYPASWQAAPAAWYRRRFRTTELEAAPTDRVRLCFDAVAGYCTVWLDGVRLGENGDSFLPFRFDVTPLVQADGEHELIVLVNPPPRQGDLWLQPCGSWVGWYLRGIWQSVYLEAVPGLAIDDVFVQPSVRDGRLRVDVTVDGAIGGAEADVHVFVEGTQVEKDLGRQALEAKSPGERMLRFAIDWPDARLWSPEDPHLYRARARLSVGGQPVQERVVRFGFREFWIDGTGFRLNGEPIRLFGDSWHYMGPAQQNPAYARVWFDLARQTGANVIRTHAMPYPPCYFDIADEVGMLIIDESAVYGSAGTLAYDERRFWDNCRDHVRRLVKRDRNHPSIIFWSACNETVWKGGDRIFGHLLSLGGEAGKLDPTRFVSYDENDCDLGGRAPLHVGHYGTPRHWARSWVRDRPLAIHEFCSLYHGGPESVCHLGDDAVYADYLARLEAAGRDAADMFLELRSLGAASITPWNINWYCLEPIPVGSVEVVPDTLTEGGAPIRRIGARALTLNYGYSPDDPRWRPHPAYASLAECYRRQRFLLRRRPRQGFAGRPVTVEAEVWNDRPESAELVLSLTVTDSRTGGAPGRHADRRLQLDAGASTTVCLDVELPGTGTGHAMTVELRLYSNGGEMVHAESWALHVHPVSGVKVAEHRNVWVAGDSDVAVHLARQWNARRLGGDTAPDELVGDASATLVLAAESHGRTLRDWLGLDGVDAWVRRGGRIIVLPSGARDDPESLLTPVRRRFDHAYIRADGGGLLRGLTNDHFRDWPPHGDVTVMVFQRPETGPAVAALDVGDIAEGLAYSPLVLTAHGAGHVVACGLPLGQRRNDTPTAAILLGRLLHEEYPVSRSAHEFALVGDAGDPARLLFNECGVRPAGAGEILWCDGGSMATLDDSRLSRKDVDAWVAAGRTVVIDGLTPDTAPHWSDRLGIDLRLQPDTRYNVARNPDGPVPAGINNFDLCWVNRDDKQPITRFTLDLNPSAYVTHVYTVATRWEDYQTTAEQWKVAMMFRRLESFTGSRAVVAEIRRGPGRILINQLLLREARGMFRARARRIVSRYLDDLGAARDERIGPLHPRERRVVTADGYITDWLVLGPFAGGEGNPLDHPFVDEQHLEPAAGQTAGGCEWRRVVSAFPQVDLGSAFEDLPARDRVAYAAVRVYAPWDRSVLLDAPDMVALLAGADGGTKAILNGQPLGRFDFVRELVLDSDCVEGVPLVKGWNTLVIKLHNPSGPWRFAARLLTAAGEPAGDLDYRTALPEY